MNTTLTIQEILKEYGFTKLPKGTTEQQWFEYHDSVLKHEERIVRTRPNTADYSTIEAYHAATQEWEMMRSCDAPNQPGYFRANND